MHDRKPLALEGVIDIHTHLGSWFAFGIAGSDADSMVRQMDRVGVSRMVCAHEASMTADVVEGNNRVLEAMAAYPDRVMGYACVFPVNARLGIDEVKRCLDAGMVGIKLHSANGIPYTSEKYTPVWRYADEHGVPMLLHTWGGLKDLDKVFEEYRGMPVLLAHSGCTRAEEYADCAERHPHVYLELAFSGCKYGLVEYFVRRLSAERVVFGSDMPWMPLGQQIGKVVFADISEADKKAILVDNARRILNLDEGAAR